MCPPAILQFQFQAGNLSFQSVSYQWLVVGGAKAQFKGAGTINGTGRYGFLLTAIDGQLNGGGGSDKFRIKLWDLDNGDAIVYDNLMGAADDANPTTVLGGGSIVIHKSGGAAAAGATDDAADEAANPPGVDVTPRLFLQSSPVSP